MKKVFFTSLLLYSINTFAQLDSIKHLVLFQEVYFAEGNDSLNGNRDITVYNLEIEYNYQKGSIEASIFAAYPEYHNTISRSISHNNQYEIGGSHLLSKKMSAWWNYAYSNVNNSNYVFIKAFPEHRLMAGVSRQFPKTVTTSLGLNYYNLNGNLLIPNISINKTWDRFWLEYKIFGSSYESGTHTSHYISAKRIAKKGSYFQLQLGTGSVTYNNRDFYRLSRSNSFTWEMIYNLKFLRVFNLINGMYSGTDWYPNDKKVSYTGLYTGFSIDFNCKNFSD